MWTVWKCETWRTIPGYILTVFISTVTPRYNAPRYNARPILVIARRWWLPIFCLKGWEISLNCCDMCEELDSYWLPTAQKHTRSVHQVDRETNAKR